MKCHAFQLYLKGNSIWSYFLVVFPKFLTESNICFRCLENLDMKCTLISCYMDTTYLDLHDIRQNACSMDILVIL